MKIAFFNVEDWEIIPIKSLFKDAILIKDSLTLDNVDKYKDVEIISGFIYSALQKEILEKIPSLKMIATRSTGFDHIDLDYCKNNNIIVCNVPTYGERTVAEYAFALLLSLTRKIYQTVDRTKKGIFNNTDIKGMDLFGKTIGIIGLGNIGFEALKIAKGFGMNVLVYTRTQNIELAKKNDFKYVSIDELLSNSDVITLHIPYCKETHHIINKENILKIKKGAYLINTARGGLIDSEAIIIALEQNILAGVGLDVLEEEFVLREEIEVLNSEFKKKVNLEDLIYDYMLIKDERVIITPHNAYNSKEALGRILNTTLENINNFIKKSPKNCCY